MSKESLKYPDSAFTLLTEQSSEDSFSACVSFLGS